MRSLSITLVAALFGTATSTPCYSLGMNGDGTQMQMLGGLNPFGPQPDGVHWDVVDASDCWARWQALKEDQTQLNQAMVTKTVFTATEDEIRATINNFHNDGNTNIQLWLPLHTRSLQYTHMLPGTLSRDQQAISPQSSLSDITDVMVSIILPSGTAKLSEVNYSRTGDAEKDKNLDVAKDMAITGLQGTISQDDYAYITGAELYLAVRNILREQKGAFYARSSWSATDFAWALAEKANGDCVVLDFRGFADFVIRSNPAPRT